MSQVMGKPAFGDLRPKRPAMLQKLTKCLGISDTATVGFIISAANNQGIDRTVFMRTLITAFVLRIWHNLDLS